MNALLLRADYLIADPSLLERSVIPGGALVIEEDRVVAVGPWEEIEKQYAHLSPLFSPENRLVIPGLVNAHHHGRALDTRQVGMADKPLELWLPGFLLYPDADSYWTTLLCAARMLQGGVTTSLQAHSRPGPFDLYEQDVRRSLDAYRDAGVRVAFAVGLYDQKFLAYEADDTFQARLPEPLRRELLRHFPPQTLYPDTDTYFRLFETLLDEHRADDRVRLLLNPIGLHWASDALLGRMRDARDRLGVGVHLHLLETPYQKVYAARLFGKTPAEVLQAFGLLGEHTSLAHGVWSSAGDVRLYAQTGTTVVTNPSSNLRLGSGLLPLGEMLEQNVTLALGTDSMSLFGEDDLLAEMTLLGALHRPAGLESRWSPYEALRAATVGGAKAAMFGEVGKLLPGYHADIAVIDLKRFREPYVYPETDTVALALSKARADDVKTVLVNGRVMVEEGRLTHLDLREVQAHFLEGLKTTRFEEKRLFLAKLEPYLQELYKDWL